MSTATPPTGVTPSTSNDDSGPIGPRPAHVQRLERAIDERTARVGVIGLGYVGLPLVELFAGRGFPVLGLDIDPAKVERLQAGQSYIGHIASERVAALRDGGQFEATADFSRLAEADAILICVPTPLGTHREPDLAAVLETGRTIGRHLRPGQLVVLESTTYPGTTRDVLRPELEAGGLARRPRLLPRLQPRARGPGQPQVLGGQHPQGRRRLGRAERRAGAAPLRGGRPPGRPGLVAARWPRRARSSKTPTGP